MAEADYDLDYLLWLMGRNVEKQGKQENTKSYL